jgi:hypothetical protein
MVVVYKLTKDAHFIRVKLIHKGFDIAKIDMKEIARFYGVPKAIISNKDPKFTSNFWMGLFKGFGRNLNFSIAYHPQIDGKTEKLIR